MRDRLEFAEAMLRERTHVTDIDGIRREVMDEFEIVLTQMPYVGGAASRMSDFFMRLMGFMAISRVLRRHGVPVPVIGEIERDTYKAQLLTVSEAERLASGRQFMSPENRDLAARAGGRERHKGSSGRVSGRLRLRFRRAGSARQLRIRHQLQGLRLLQARSAPRGQGHPAEHLRPRFRRLRSAKASVWSAHKHWRAARATAISASRGYRRMRL